MQGEPGWAFSRSDTICLMFDEEALAAVTVGWGGLQRKQKGQVGAYGNSVGRRWWCLGEGCGWKIYIKTWQRFKPLDQDRLYRIYPKEIIRYTQRYTHKYNTLFGLPRWRCVNHLPANAGDDEGDASSILGSERSPGGGNSNPAPVFFPGKFHGQRSLVGYSPWSHKELDTTEHAGTCNTFITALVRKTKKKRK